MSLNDVFTYFYDLTISFLIDELSPRVPQTISNNPSNTDKCHKAPRR